MALYKIVRMHFNRPSRAVRGLGGLTLQEAQEHCRRPDTHAKGICEPCGYGANTHEESECPTCGQRLHRPWFDGYQQSCK